MRKLENIISYLTKYIGIVIILFSILAFIIPQAFAWSTNYTSIFLGAAMFGMGLTIKADDFKEVFIKPKEIILGCIAQFTIMPLAAWGLCYLFHLDIDLAIGVILVGCCPGGTASNVITYIAKGDVSLSVGMTICSTLLAPIVTPGLVYVLAGTWVDVSISAMIISVVKVILLPVLLGILVHRLLGKKMETISSFVPLISVVAIVFIIAGIIANNIEKIISCGILVLCVVVIHNFVGIVLGLIVSELLHIDYDKATAIAIEVGMQNSGLAVNLATTHFVMNPLATLPGAIFSVWHNVSGSIFASIRNHFRKEG
ncbi:MAG: bile acid:sodium symporter family protein [Faecalibacillus sp.]